MPFRTWWDLHDELPDGAFLARLEEDGFDLAEVPEAYGEEIATAAVRADPAG